MTEIFTRAYRARYSDINADGLLAPADIARYIVDTAYDWAETLGLGDRSSQALGIYWLIRETEIEFLSPLHFQDEFDFSIWMLEWKRVRGRRAFAARHRPSGAMAARGVQQIACMDVQTQRPTAPPDDLIANFRLEAPPEMASRPFPRIAGLPERALRLELRPAWQDLDSFDMVNNAVYIAYAEEAAARLLAACGWPPGRLRQAGLRRQVRRVQVQYHQPVGWGQALSLGVFSLGLDPAGGSVYVRMADGSGGAAVADCVLDWGLAEADGAAASLPEALAAALQDTREG